MSNLGKRRRLGPRPRISGPSIIPEIRDRLNRFKQLVRGDFPKNVIGAKAFVNYQILVLMERRKNLASKLDASSARLISATVAKADHAGISLRVLAGQLVRIQNERERSQKASEKSHG